MDQVFAPWRIEWVERSGPESDGCVFCELPERDDDRANRIIARSEHAFVLLNNYPYNPGHAMVIPYRHVETYGALDDEELLGHARLKARTLEALDEAFAPDGANVGYNLGRGAGGSIAHLHAHVVPRWEGDTNFMPVIDETKVIVQAVEETYDRLHDAFASLDCARVEGPDRAIVIEQP